MPKLTSVVSLPLFFLFCYTANARYIECKNINAPENFGPIFTAKYDKKTLSLSEMKFDYRSRVFSAFRLNKTENLKNWGNKPRIKKGVLHQPKGTAVPEAITSRKRTTYFGNNAYAIVFGHYTDKWPSEDFPELKEVESDRDYSGELVLPNELSPEVLEDFRFKGRETEKSNAVMIYDAAPEDTRSGLNYLRMYCTSVEKLAVKTFE